MKLIDKVNVVGLTTSTASFCSSLLIAIMILSASGGLSTPYRRIIFGLSVSDIIQSLAIILGPFLLPSDEDSRSGSSWAIGNVHTCDFQGFIVTFGAATTCMYTLFLCLYYHCKLKRNMNDSRFQKKIETKMHCFIVLFNAIVCTIELATKTFNPLPGIGSCQTMRKPFRCDPSVPGSCERGHFSFYFGLFYFPVAIPCICLLGTLILMFSIVVHVVKRDRLFRPHSRNKNDTIEEEETEADKVARLLRREVTLQVVLYVLAFLLTYGLVVVMSFISRANGQPSLLFAIIVAISFPLMGLFNILIYTRPQIVAYRRLHRDVSWPVAFWRVLKAGGENPDSAQISSQSRSTACCHGQFCCRWFKSYEKEDESKVPSGMLRFRALFDNRISGTSDLFIKNEKKERHSMGTDLMERRISMECNNVEHGTEEGRDEGDGARSSSSRINDEHTANNVRDMAFLSSQKDVISKAFEKASQRARAMNKTDVVKNEDIGMVSHSEWSGVNRINSEWSHGVSPGSLSGSFVDNMEVSNDVSVDFADD